MTDYPEVRNVGMPPMPADVSRVGDLARFSNRPVDGDVEVIDLDNSRDQIKPTTWHG